MDSFSDCPECDGFKQHLKHQFRIASQWDGRPLDHVPAELSLRPRDGGLELFVQAPFFNDPGPPPSSQPGQTYPGLWEYEVVEAFFLSSKSNKYLEVELNPHGVHLVLLLDGRRNCIKEQLPLDTRVSIDGGTWSCVTLIPPGYFPRDVDLFNAFAIHGSGDKRTYESLYPIPSGLFKEPDFHRLEYFKHIDLTGALRKEETQSEDLWG